MQSTSITKLYASVRNVKHDVFYATLRIFTKLMNVFHATFPCICTKRKECGPLDLRNLTPLHENYEVTPATYGAPYNAFF